MHWFNVGLNSALALFVLKMETESISETSATIHVQIFYRNQVLNPSAKYFQGRREKQYL
jgi:hypothetical protein